MAGYDYWLNVIATDQNAGNSLSSLIAAEPGDHTAFDRGIPLYTPDTTFQDVQDGPVIVKQPSKAAVAWLVPVPVRESAYLPAAEYMGDGPYPLLNGMGVSDAQIAGLKTLVFVDAQERAAGEANLANFISERGYIRG
jgi:hypothetical protein